MTYEEYYRLLWRLDYLIYLGVNMVSDFEDLKVQVSKNTSIEQSAVVLIQGIAQRLKDAAGDPVAVRALADQLRSSAGPLADAVAANTVPAV